MYEEVHSVAKLGNRKVQQQFLERLRPLLPPQVMPITIADSRFRTPIFRAVERFGWHWLGRIRIRILDYVSVADRPEAQTVVDST